MNATVKEIVEILQKKMSNDDVGFFANLAIYKLAQIATNMHATVTYIGGERIPVNVYALSAALSGFAKGKSLKYVEQKVVNEFKREFERNVMTYRPIPILEAKADELAIAHGTDPAKELDAIYKQITKLPKYIYTFGSGSTPEGLKNLMTLLSMKETGAVTIEVDEIGSMLSANKEVLDNLLMSYDAGLIKHKLKATDSNDDIVNPCTNKPYGFWNTIKVIRWRTNRRNANGLS